MSERTPASGANKIGTRKFTATPAPVPPPPPAEPTPANGWDLLDDFQVGKDVSNRAAENTVLLDKAADGPGKPAVRDASTTPHWNPSLYGSDHEFKADPNWKPPAPDARPAKGATRSFRASREQDAATMAKIDARQRAQTEEAQAAAERARIANERDAREAEKRKMDQLRAKQWREAEEAMERQRRADASWGTVVSALGQVMQEVADRLLALSICPDHLEYSAALGKYVRWDGAVFTQAELLAQRDERGERRYVPEVRDDGGIPVFFSAREIKWGLDQPLSPDKKPFSIERVLPVVRKHADGTARFSARKAGFVTMDEGIVVVFVFGKRVLFGAQMEAAYRAHAKAGGLGDRMAAAAERVTGGVAGARDVVAGTAARAAKSLKDEVVPEATMATADLVATGAQKVKGVLKGLTGLFRKDKK